MTQHPLTPDQLRRLRELLMRCEEFFDTNAALRTLFGDPRLLLWRGSLREADRLAARVDFTIDYLRDKMTTAGDHGLVLLLWVLAEKYDALDARHDLLLAMASELAYGFRVSLPPKRSKDPERELERAIRASNSLLDIRAWIARLASIERCMCRISVTHEGKTEHGTGFLVAPDVVMTNYHVVERVIDKLAPPSSVRLLFDYHILEDGVTPHVGPSYQLAAPAWLVDSSPYSPLDLKAASDATPEPDKLDYALLRVAGTPGSDHTDGGKAFGFVQGPRGFIPLPEAEHVFTPNSALLIVQHPDGKELKVAIETDAILAVNGNGTRVRYRTNTEPGASGSPCFDASWNLVALHHSGDPNYTSLYQPEYNQGIPLAAIRRLLQQRGKLDALVASAAAPTPPLEDAPPDSSAGAPLSPPAAPPPGTPLERTSQAQPPAPAPAPSPKDHDVTPEPSLAAMTPQQLRRFLIDNFNTSELRAIANELRIELENLSVGAKPDQVLELINFLRRRGRLGELPDAIKRAHPDFTPKQ
jgi:hypothetical protein